MSRFLISCFLLFLWLSSNLFAQHPDEAEKMVTFELQYTGDNAVNFSGGLKRGYRYLGMVHLITSIDLGRAGWWTESNLFLHLANTHGATPSASLFGDVQVASNIEAGNHIYVQEFWVSKTLGDFEFIAGLQDLNAEFAVSEYGSLFLNSSFGVLPTVSQNISVPIFPLTTLGFTSRWIASETSTLLLAFYDGKPTDFRNNPYNLSWHFGNGDGLLAVTEFQKKTDFLSLPGTYKIGLFSHSQFIEKIAGQHVADSLKQSMYGFYAHIDQKIWEQNGRSLGGFIQLGNAPLKKAYSDYYLGAGLNFVGLSGADQLDVLGLALAYEHFSSGTASEVALELTYQYPLTKVLVIQPDMQYIVNPAGADEKIDNCLAGFLRLHLSL